MGANLPDTSAPHRGRKPAGNAGDSGRPAPIPAATVVLMRDTARDVEVLMLHKASSVSFGGMWVFPGGRIDPGDYPPDGDTTAAAAAAAARETREEAGIDVSPDEFVWFSHWTPPPGPARRFSTWFFAAATRARHAVEVDGGEIQDHAWISPQTALDRHQAGEIDLVPPTWVTLHHLARRNTTAGILDHFNRQPPRTYATRISRDRDGTRIALWEGDAGYDSRDAGAAGDRHRLVMSPGAFRFENTVVDY